MKLLMATCSDETQLSYGKFTLPILRMYAKKWKATFKILDDRSYNKMGFAMWNYRTMEFHSLLEVYDKVVYMDSDIVINKTCPNLFDVVPSDTIGLIFEDKGSRLQDRRRRITLVKTTFGGNEQWTSGLPNGGFYIVSKCHRNIFRKINGRLYDGPGCDGSHYMYQIIKFGYKYVDLGYKFNHMSMFSESWNGSPSRFDSYIIHYAGSGSFPDKGKRDRIELMANDVRKIYG